MIICLTNTPISFLQKFKLRRIMFVFNHVGKKESWTPINHMKVMRRGQGKYFEDKKTSNTPLTLRAVSHIAPASKTKTMYHRFLPSFPFQNDPLLTEPRPKFCKD